ncbi:hypothetical protein MLD38_033544 [Melastoma candidum]|uniref:Uncharacterized protein n=1 Tax=Melastoma candidum TaxID=119954 RepID=A0ACB9M735_9MYRT|nr:hypothetical protein MLD38_033544 [Melastoma candidum]
MEQKVVLKVMMMTDNKTKQKAIEAAADIFGVDMIAADMKEQKLTAIGHMDTIAVVKRLKKVGKVMVGAAAVTEVKSRCSRGDFLTDILSVGPVKEENKEEKKEEKKEEEEEKKEEAPKKRRSENQPTPPPLPQKTSPSKTRQ